MCLVLAITILIDMNMDSQNSKDLRERMMNSAEKVNKRELAKNFEETQRGNNQPDNKIKSSNNRCRNELKASRNQCEGIEQFDEKRIKEIMRIAQRCREYQAALRWIDSFNKWNGLNGLICKINADPLPPKAYHYMYLAIKLSNKKSKSEIILDKNESDCEGIELQDLRKKSK